MAVMIDPEKSSLLRAAPRLMQILRVLARHKCLGALRGKRHWPPPKEVRETFEELGLTCNYSALLQMHVILSETKNPLLQLSVKNDSRSFADAQDDIRTGIC